MPRYADAVHRLAKKLQPQLNFSSSPVLQLGSPKSTIEATTSIRNLGNPLKMAKEDSKKEKKEKKRKHSEVEDAEVQVVAERKKDKKDRKRKSTDLDGDVTMDTSPGTGIAVVKDEEEDEDEKKVIEKEEVPLAALVPFANPLCDEKAQKKVLKGVKKGKTSCFYPFYCLDDVLI
jgi:hypothetical protein